MGIFERVRPMERPDGDTTYLAGQPLDNMDVYALIVTLLPYLDKYYVERLLEEVTGRKFQLQGQKSRMLRDEIGWWKPKTAEEMMPDEAKIMALEIYHPEHNPSAGCKKINAIKVCRDRIRDPETGGTLGLRKAKDLVETYMNCVQEGIYAFPSHLVETPKKRTRIIRNAVRCKLCNEVIESKHRHDFVWCSCGETAVDGGHDYLRRCGNAFDMEELSESEEVED